MNIPWKSLSSSKIDIVIELDIVIEKEKPPQL